MPRVACYVRVSTPDQNLDRQLESTTEHAEREVDADLAEIEVYRDESTGTDTDRSGFQSTMGDAEAGEIDAVVAHSITRVSRSIQDLERTAGRLEDHGVEFHIVSESIVLDPDSKDDPFQRAMHRMLGIFAEYEADMIQQRTKEGLAARMREDDYSHGPAPLGFQKDDGRLVEGDEYHEVVAVLGMVRNDNLSKRKAADRLDCGRATINRSLDRLELYGL
ncbi:recombinase family protein [Halobaculum sp. MBLA0143]|uniref:recombinase family protein n=1 Tax=Halobaculum sp. MBLA0143 TaxID=3079933 RepID=UPI003526B830